MLNKKIILLIPHYNNPEGLAQSLLSIDDEVQIDVLVIDDGSEIKPNYDFLTKNYNQGQIFYKEFSNNQGLSLALNEGIRTAREKGYQYIARLDCGDFCKKNRFSKQLNYLANNSDIKLLGTWARYIDENRKELYILKHPTDHDKIRKNMFINSMFVHPSVLIDIDVFREVKMYNPKYTRAAQDYDLFFRITKKYKTANYPEALIDYTVSPDSISSRRRKLQVKHRIMIIMDNFYFGFYPIYGLIRNVILYFVSRETANRLKKIKG